MWTYQNQIGQKNTPKMEPYHAPKLDENWTEMILKTYLDLLKQRDLKWTQLNNKTDKKRQKKRKY